MHGQRKYCAYCCTATILHKDKCSFGIINVWYLQLETISNSHVFQCCWLYAHVPTCKFSSRYGVLSCKHKAVYCVVDNIALCVFGLLGVFSCSMLLLFLCKQFNITIPIQPCQYGTMQIWKDLKFAALLDHAKKQNKKSYSRHVLCTVY